MSYWRPGIWVLFRSWLTADTTLTNALGGAKVFLNQAPTGTAFPYITFNMSSCTMSDTFGDVGRSIVMDFHVWTDLRVSGSDTTGTRATILERIHGNFDEPGGLTYGLHRWTPGQIPTNTGWWVNTVVCRQELDLSTLEQGHDVYSVAFEVFKKVE